MKFAKQSSTRSSPAIVTSIRELHSRCWIELSQANSVSALAYGNESEVGQGIKDSGVPRSEIWLTTKLDNTWHKRVQEGIDSSLKSLGTDYVDLYLMPWPSSTVDDEKRDKHEEGWTFTDTWYGRPSILLPSN